MSEPLPTGDEVISEYSIEDVKQIAAALDAMAVEARDPWDLLQKLTSSVRSEGMQFDRSPLVLFVERALAHGMEEHQQYPGAVTLGVRFSSPAGDWPPAFDAVSQTEKSAWAAVAAEVGDALPRAQMLDLTLSAGIRGGRDLAEEITRLYLELGGRVTLDPYYRGSCLRRAWSISRQFALPLEADSRKALYVMALSLVGAEGVPAGVLLQPLESLTVVPRIGEFVEPTREAVKALLATALPPSGTDTSITEGVTALLERLAISGAEREEARRILIGSYLASAENSTGLVAVHWFQTAATKAQQVGLIDLRDRAISALQAIPVDELEMEAHTFDFALPRHLHDGRLHRYRWSRDSLSALNLWLTSSSPTGSHEDNLRQASKISRSGIIQLVTRTTFNASGLPVRTTVGPDEAEREQLERTESMNAGVYGILLARELEAIKTEYGLTPAENLAAHVVEHFRCDAELATVLGESIVSFWDGRYSDAGRAAFPLVEAGARGLLLALGDPLYRIQTGNTDGKFPALETYATRLEAHHFDIDWLRCLRNPVAGLRNVLAHGHRFQLHDHEAAVLIRMAALLVVLTPANSGAEDRTQLEARLRDPIGWTGTQARLVRRWKRVWTVGSDRARR